MKIAFTLTVLFLLPCKESNAQAPDLKTKILAINRTIDEAVVAKNIVSLDTLYANDFVFTHGTGSVDSKKSWLENVARKDQIFVSRIQDSTSVESHSDVNIVTGRLSISRKDGEKKVRYGIWYVRVFAQRGMYWQLISHRTTKEWHY